MEFSWGARKGQVDMKAQLSSIIDQSKFLSRVNYFKGQLLYRLGLNSHRSGSTHASLGIDESVAYIEQVVADYLRYAGVQTAHLAGKHVLEVGPGDNLGVALSLIAKGAASVTCLDRFQPLRDERQNAAIYRRLVDQFSEEEQERVQNIILWKQDIARFSSDRIVSIYGFPVEKAAEKIGGRKFDIIASRAVLEHVSNLKAAWESMVCLLQPLGEMWHKIDFRNHGKFDQFHPLYFLTLSEAMWKLLTSPDPTLNRERFPTYRRLAEGAFRSSSYYITHVLQGGELHPHKQRLSFGTDYGNIELEKVTEIRPRLDRRFSELSDEDLLASGIFLICRGLKRGHTAMASTSTIL